MAPIRGISVESRLESGLIVSDAITAEVNVNVKVPTNIMPAQRLVIPSLEVVIMSAS